MDSVLEEDVTLPGTLSGCSGLVSKLPDDLEGISPIAGVGNGVLPKVSEETVSPTRARNMKDFENQITELKKENFNLKLRIYFLEERMQQEFDGPTEHIYKTNIELKVEVESLKRELQEREQLLIKASKAVESLAEGGGSELRRVKDAAQKKLQQVEELLNGRILLLEEDGRAARAELEKAFAGTEAEKALRLSLESKLSEMKKMHEGHLDVTLVLEEKDRLIEDLKLSLKSKEALIQCLKEEKSQMAAPDENGSSAGRRALSAAPAPREGKEGEAEAVHMECQTERCRFEERIQALQEDLREKEREIATEKKNSLKRDKAIQGLTMALKSKEKEVEKLNSEIEELSAAFARAKEAGQEAQTQKFPGSEDHGAAVMEKAALLAELRSEKLTRGAENHRLRRTAAKAAREPSDARREADLEAARRERSPADHAIYDLRKEVEKLRNEANEREKAVEEPYKSLLSESDNKLHRQEQVTRQLTERTGPKDKDLLLQKFSEEDSEAVQQDRSLTTAEGLGSWSEELATEKRSSRQSLRRGPVFSEEKQQLDYEELMRVLQKERDIYTHLVQALQDSDGVRSLQAEVSRVSALRKQLERDVLAYGNLQKALEEQISDIRRREEEPFSFYSDQTSYLSICLEENNRFQVEHFSQEELKEKVGDLIQLVKDLYTDNQHLKKAIFDLSCMGFQGVDRLESTEAMELPASKEDEDTIRIGEDDESNFLSDQHLDRSNKMIEDYSKGGCKNGYLRHTDSSVLGYDGAHRPAGPRDQSLEEGELMHLLAPFFNEKAIALLESRPDLLKVLCELLLERMWVPEQEIYEEHLEGKTEKTLKQMAVQLRGELRQFIPAGSFAKPRDEPQSPRGAQLVKAEMPSVVGLEDAAVQTMAMEGGTLGVRPEGCTEAWEVTRTGTAPGPGAPPEDPHQMPAPGGSDTDAQEPRVPVQMRLSWPLGTGRPPATQDTVAQLQGHILELQGELKEFKMRNKQLHQKLLLAEAMMEGSSAPGGTPAKDSDVDQPGGLAISPTCTGDPPEVQVPASATMDLSSQSRLSAQGGAAGTDQSEGGRNVLCPLQQPSQRSEAVVTVLCGAGRAPDSPSKPGGGSDEEEMTFSSLHQVRYAKRVQVLHPPAPQRTEAQMPGAPERRLAGQEGELQDKRKVNAELFSELCHLQNPFRDLSPSRYSSLVQSQARELSLQRQQLKDSHGVCVIYHQHMDTVIQAFEELLQASDVDDCVAEGFREQLSQCAGLLEKLEALFVNGKSVGMEMSPQNGLMERVEENSLTCQHVLPGSPEPSASRTLSDCDVSERSSSSRDQQQDSETEKTSVITNNFSQDLLMEHIQEIRSLRNRLEESIKTNEKLRRQLERQGSEAGQGSSNTLVCGSELHNSLVSEIRFLRRQNQALNAMLAKGSRDKQKENEKLRESLSRKTANLEHLQREFACVKGEKERLQQEVGQRERHSQQLLRELCDSRSELGRALEELEWRQQLLSQDQQLLRSLRVELKVFEKLGEEHGRPRESAAEASGEGWQGQDPLSDLHSLLAEVRTLRAQLERSIDARSLLRGSPGEQLALPALPAPTWPLPRDRHGGDGCPMENDHPCDLLDSALAVPLRSETPPLSRNEVDPFPCDSGGLATGSPSALCLVPGQRLWASQSGRHVLGLMEDYDALCGHIGQSQQLLAEIDCQIREAPSWELGAKGPCPAPPSGLVTSVSRAKLSLEEASRLLTLLWRVAVPTDGQCTLHCGQVGEMKAEITKLHKKLFEQEKNLHNTLKLLQLSKHQERVIFDQLVVTHKVLRKARGNLELRPGGAHPGAPSPGRPGS